MDAGAVALAAKEARPRLAFATSAADQPDTSIGNRHRGVTTDHGRTGSTQDPGRGILNSVHALNTNGERVPLRPASRLPSAMCSNAEPARSVVNQARMSLDAQPQGLWHPVYLDGTIGPFGFHHHSHSSAGQLQ